MNTMLIFMCVVMVIVVEMIIVITVVELMVAITAREWWWGINYPWTKEWHWSSLQWNCCGKINNLNGGIGDNGKVVVVAILW